MKKSISIFFLLLLICSCRQEHNQVKKTQGPGLDQMAELNRFMVQKDRERILNYIERKGLKMQETETGLWYFIKNEGVGLSLVDFDRITMDYKCSLLDGTICYSSDETGPREIIIGRTEIEAGLYQGLRLLKPGAEAILIIPPFLGYGLKGDSKKIPSRAIIVYNIHILHTQK